MGMVNKYRVVILSEREVGPLRVFNIIFDISFLKKVPAANMAKSLKFDKAGW